MSRETKLGFFAIVVIALAIWGYKYLKGQNLLSNSYKFSIVYDNVDQLTISSPVLINGLNVGSVTSVRIDEDDLTQMIVKINIGNDYKIPKDAIAYQVNNGVIGGKAISIKYDETCTGDNCAESGDRLEGKVLGFISSLIGQEDVDGYLSNVSSELSQVVAKLGSEDSKGALNESIRELSKTMKNIESLTRTSDALLKNSYSGLSETVENMSVITGNLAKNNDQITSLLSNLNTITTDLKNANIANTVSTTNATLGETKVAIEKLQGTLDNADEMVTSLRGVIQKVDNGSGSLGKLINDQELYTNLERTSKNMSLLLQDLRLNPKRYVNVSIFGKKDEQYVLPENDPAYQPKED